MEDLLRKRLEDSGFSEPDFEAAGTALLIIRQKAGQRLPLWLSRMRSKKLLDSVKRYPDFPIALEAWRSCLKDEFDMESLKQVLSELEQGVTDISYVRTSVVSPFASSVAWRQINDRYMYDSDDPRGGEASKLREDLIRSIAFDDGLRPTVSQSVIDEYESKRQRLAPGYGPTDALELKEWLRDRIALSEEEWNRLSELLTHPESSVGENDEAERLGDFSVPISRSGGCVYLEEESERVQALFAPDPNPDLFSEWISYFGPVSVDLIRSRFSKAAKSLDALLDVLADDRKLVIGKLVEGSDEVHVCDYDNFESLLRMQRARNRPTFDPPSDRFASAFFRRTQWNP